MIRVHGLTKEFNDFNGVFRALDNVSFEVKPGEIYGLLGPNGAGKTTCLRIVSTVLKPSRGFAEVAGINVMRDAAGVRSKIGFMSNNTGIYDRMTAREMVEYFGRLYGIPEDKLQPRIEEIFDVLQMHEIRDRLGSKMSTGMKQKVSIARTMIHDPEVVVFDEPTSGLDPVTSRTIDELINRLRDNLGVTSVVVTHDMISALTVSDRIAMLHKGEVVEVSTPAEFLASTHPEVRKFLDAQYISPDFLTQKDNAI